jgi:hypothetical protein
MPSFAVIDAPERVWSRPGENAAITAGIGKPASRAARQVGGEDHRGIG